MGVKDERQENDWPMDVNNKLPSGPSPKQKDNSLETRQLRLKLTPKTPSSNPLTLIKLQNQHKNLIKIITYCWIKTITLIY